MLVEYVTIIIVPLVMAITSIISYLVGYRRSLKIALMIVYGFMLGWAILLTSLSYLGITLSAFGMEFRIDALSSIFILTSMIVAVSCLIYSYHYMEYYVSKHELNLKRLGLYYSLLTITILTVYLMAISNNAFILWVVVEATTLTTAFLVGYGRYEGALEASWKYLLLCVVGLTTALYGTSLIYSYIFDITGNPYFGILFTDIARYVKTIEPTTLTLASIMVLMGYGVKAGLAPLHWWLPDAYSEAPSAISALLSSIVTGCGAYAILRWLTVLSPVFNEVMRATLIVIGFASIFLGFVSMILQEDLKRMLAYSSIGNMGIISLASAYPPIGFAFAVMHLFNHSILKVSTFLLVGDLEYRYGRRSRLYGVISDTPILGLALLVGILALEGTPPFSTFYSIFGPLTAMKNPLIIAIYLIGVFIGFIAITHRFIETAWGSRMNLPTGGNYPRSMLIIPIILILITLILGLYPNPLLKMCRGGFAG